MIETREEQIRANLQRLAAIHAATSAMLEESVAILEAELDALTRAREPSARTADLRTSFDEPVIEHLTMCVVYRGKRCPLGNTLKLKFLERLLLRPNTYFSHRELFCDVWKGRREPSSLRSVVKELRARLRAAGMSRLSDAIDGHVYGHYGLMLNQIQ